MPASPGRSTLERVARKELHPRSEHAALRSETVLRLRADELEELYGARLESEARLRARGVRQ
jgi:hypothetical protein